MANPNSDPRSVLDALPVEAIAAYLADKLLAQPARSVTTTDRTPDEFLSPAEAAKLLNVSRKYVYGHVRELGGVRMGQPSARGRLVARQDRRRIRFLRSVILARIAR